MVVINAAIKLGFSDSLGKGASWSRIVQVTMTVTLLNSQKQRVAVVGNRQSGQ